MEISDLFSKIFNPMDSIRRLNGNDLNPVHVTPDVYAALPADYPLPLEAKVAKQFRQIVREICWNCQIEDQMQQCHSTLTDTESRPDLAL